MPSKFLRVRSAAVAGLVTLSIGGVTAAAAGGLAPTSPERAATRAPSTPGAPGKGTHARGVAVTATLTDGPGAAAASRGSGSDGPGDHAAGPDASGPARRGLCQAWLAGQGDVHGRRADAPAFQALAAAAGGADQIHAYCQAEPGVSAKQRGGPVTPPTSTGRRQDPPGHGHGQGGPPTTS